MQMIKGQHKPLLDRLIIAYLHKILFGKNVVGSTF